jgi:hypothetical protein
LKVGYIGYLHSFTKLRTGSEDPEPFDYTQDKLGLRLSSGFDELSRVVEASKGPKDLTRLEI